MNLSFALDHIPRRMNELGFANKYFTRMRHLVLREEEEIKIEGMSDYYYLIDEHPNLRVESHHGVYDLQDKNTNELQHEHHGQITLQNKDSQLLHVIMIQVIPFK